MSRMNSYAEERTHTLAGVAAGVAASNLTVEIKYERLPLWTGLTDQPSPVAALPFSIGWNPLGYVHQTTPPHIQEKVVAAYASADYRFITAPPGASEWGNRLGKRKLDAIERFYGDLNGKTILEPGAGSTYIAEVVMDSHDVDRYVAVDPALREEPRNPKLEVVRSYFNPDSYPNYSYDLIVSFSVFEHLQDPRRFLTEVNKLLAVSDGRALLQFPTIEQQFRRGDLNAILHEHINYFTEESIRSLLSQCGLRIAAHEESRDVLTVLLVYEGAPVPDDEIQTFDQDELLFIASDRLFYNCRRVSSELSRVLDDGETVAFHGACNGLNNFLYLSGLGSHPNLQIYDGDATKVGRFLPAAPHAPVRSAEDETYRRADRVIVAATSFYDEIRDFLVERHGRPRAAISPLFSA